jgi:hypothetical protein
MPKQELVAFTKEEFAEVKRLLLYLKRGGIDRPYYRPRWPILDGDNVQPLPSGDCDCCPGCVCYPEDEDDITDDCDAIGCLLKNYRIVANLPFSGTTTLAWDTGCIFKTASFNVTLCEDEDYGDHFWRLTVGAGIGDSTLELINDGGTDIPVEYVSQRPFRMLCATEFVFKEKCAIYADDYLKSIGHTWPTKLCVNPVGDTDCVVCDVPDPPICASVEETLTVGTNGPFAMTTSDSIVCLFVPPETRSYTFGATLTVGSDAFLGEVNVDSADCCLIPDALEDFTVASDGSVMLTAGANYIVCLFNAVGNNTYEVTIT